MHDRDLYAHLLGLAAPWSVDRVTLDVGQERVDVYLVHDDGSRFSCPQCAVELVVYDHAEERVWRHLDTCQCKTMVHARVPRVRCAEHGVRQVAVPWSEERARFTSRFERFAIDVLSECDIAGAASILRISWDECQGIKHRAVRRGLERRRTKAAVHLGVDEKSWRFQGGTRLCHRGLRP